MDHHHPLSQRGSGSKLESWGATLGAGGRGVMRAAAGGLTLRRGDSVASSGPSKQLVSIAVIGLSGSERDKGSMGVGKSCLCNRFIHPMQDDYSVDHISVFSQSDFCGRVVNNDHYLYWGEVLKTNEEGTEFHIQVIEQTEFIDDASFQTFRGSGKNDNYAKRCTQTKLVSAEKLMYICKDQLGIEKEYEQKLMPDGKFTVDGFLLVLDVSVVPNRPLEKQVEIGTQIINNVLKTKKPLVIATTKNDEANELFVREVERLLNRKELKNLNIPVIETSAHENVNVDTAFFALAQLVDRTRGRTRIPLYHEAAHMRREILDIATERYLHLLRQQVSDFGVLWSSVNKKLVQYQEYDHYCELFGKDSAHRLFKRHIKKLKDDYLGNKVQRYLDLLPEVLHELFPDIESLGEGDWALVRQRIQDHPDFDQWFVDYPEDTTWMEADLFDGDPNENRIPFGVLDLPDAETVYKNLLNQLHAQHKRMELRQDFKKLLEEMGCVTPGKSLNEVKVLFLGRECFESLPEKDLLEIYDLHQREIIAKAKKNFQELLLERADLFYQFRSSPAGTVTQDDIYEITEILQEDSRYKALDRLDADRKLMLFQHLGFVHCPIREHCPAFPNCTDTLIERIVARKAARPPSWSRTCDSNHLNLVVLGVEGLANDLANNIRTMCRDDEFEHQGQIFSFDYRTVSGDVSLPENAFRTQDFLPHGCFCVYSDPTSFEYIRHSLEKTLLSNLEQEDRLPFQGLPLVIVFAAETTLSEKDVLNLREEGQNLADSLQCPYIDISPEELLSTPRPDRFGDGLIDDAVRALIESIRHRSGILNIYKSQPNTSEPDIRIIMCMLCGDPYSIENVLGPLLTHQNCYLSSGERSIAIETQLGESKRKVEVILSSYHSATDFREELIHGFILVYSTKRKASLATLSAFSMNIPELPIQLLAVTDNTTTSLTSTASQGIYTNDLGPLLIAEGNNLADRLNAHFMTSTSSIQQKSSFYTPFFKEVFEKKSEIERAFAMEDSASRLDDSGEGTLERPRRHQPIPPPRIDSYRIRGPPSNPSRSGSGSEIYERLPDSGSLGDDIEDRIHMSPSDDSDVYSHVDSMDRQRPINGQEHLVKPSQIKNKKKQGWVDDSIFIRRNDQDEEMWGNGSVNPGAFTTGRRGRPPAPPPIKPRQQVPGKLNMNDFHKVSAALTTMQIDSKRSPRSGTVPLAASEDIDQSGYAIPRDNVVNRQQQNEYAQPIIPTSNESSGGRHKPRYREKREQIALQQADDSDSDTTSSSDETRNSGGGGNRKSTGPAHAQKRHRKKKPIAVATPKVPLLPPAMPPRIAPPPPQPQNTEAQDQALLLLSDTDDDSPPPSYPPPSSRLRYKPLRSGSGSGGSSQPSRRHRASSGRSSSESSRTPYSPFAPLQSPMFPQTSDSDLFASKYEAESPRDGRSMDGGRGIDGMDATPPSSKEAEKQRRKLDKEMKQRQKDVERRKMKDEKKRIKEAEKQEKERRDAEAKERKKEAKSKMKANSIQAQPTLEDFRPSAENPIPVFLAKAIGFIEKEGLDAEGLYRVPGNRAHVDLLFQKFDEDHNVDIDELDIAVNAVATAVKDFFFKRLPPILGPDHMAELENISLLQDRSIRTLELGKLLKRLPKTNFAVLKFIFQHFVKVTEASKDNCMDSKNLAICWWPTLLQYEFGDLGKFEAMRPHLEDIVQTMIDQYRFLFCGQEEVMMV